MAESSSDMCVVCSKVGGGSTSAGGGGRFLGPKGRALLIQVHVSQKRNDGALYEELQQRLLSIAYVNGPPDQSIFTYELATVAPSLFQDDGSMRKSQKSQLAQHIMKMSPNITEHPVEQPAATVIDGCALLYRLA